MGHESSIDMALSQRHINLVRPRIPRAVVIGAGRGIGRAVAIALAGAGYLVSCGARSATDLAVLSVEAERQFGEGRVTCATVDITDPAAVENFLTASAGTARAVDLLVVSAGVAWLGGVETSVQQMTEMVMTNLAGPFYCLHYARDYLKITQGTVVLLASRAARACYPQSLAYGATKAGLVYLIQAAARDLAKDGISIVGLSPGAVATPLRAGLFSDEDPALLIQPTEVAQALIAILNPCLKRMSGTIVDFPW
ncbi:UNVERIFIED_ORG: NAD(P)-dependent dehydrogenase (short-subunit alcohol dehydrogenase family) [Burkholderia contaminans]|nr:NAD(P)-dependent dehydrogenase (short-subunit alcohol dehydrogenase family) [Burkholderia contaminans]